MKLRKQKKIGRKFSMLLILKYVKSGIYLKDKEVQEFLKEKKTHEQNESIKKLKDKFPHQFSYIII